MIRRLKKDVLAELPDKRRQKIQIQTDPKVIKEIQSLLNAIDIKGWNIDSFMESMVNKRQISFFF